MARARPDVRSLPPAVGNRAWPRVPGDPGEEARRHRRLFDRRGREEVRSRPPRRRQAVLPSIPRGTVCERRARRKNQASLERAFGEVARSFLVEKRLLQGGGGGGESGKWMTLLRRATTHIVLTLIALVAGMAIALPFGGVVYWDRKL